MADAQNLNTQNSQAPLNERLPESQEMKEMKEVITEERGGYKDALSGRSIGEPESPEVTEEQKKFATLHKAENSALAEWEEWEAEEMSKEKQVIQPTEVKQRVQTPEERIAEAQEMIGGVYSQPAPESKQWVNPTPDIQKNWTRETENAMEDQVVKEIEIKKFTENGEKLGNAILNINLHEVIKFNSNSGSQYAVECVAIQDGEKILQITKNNQPPLLGKMSSFKVEPNGAFHVSIITYELKGGRYEQKITALGERVLGGRLLTKVDSIGEVRKNEPEVKTEALPEKQKFPQIGRDRIGPSHQLQERKFNIEEAFQNTAQPDNIMEFIDHLPSPQALSDEQVKARESAPQMSEQEKMNQFINEILTPHLSAEDTNGQIALKILKEPNHPLHEQVKEVVSVFSNRFDADVPAEQQAQEFVDHFSEILAEVNRPPQVEEKEVKKSANVELNEPKEAEPEPLDLSNVRLVENAAREITTREKAAQILAGIRKLEEANALSEEDEYRVSKVKKQIGKKAKKQGWEDLERAMNEVRQKQIQESSEVSEESLTLGSFLGRLSNEARASWEAIGKDRDLYVLPDTRANEIKRALYEFEGTHLVLKQWAKKVRNSDKKRQVDETIINFVERFDQLHRLLDKDQLSYWMVRDLLEAMHSAERFYNEKYGENNSKKPKRGKKAKKRKSKKRR